MLTSLIGLLAAAASVSAAPGAGWDDLYACVAATERMPEITDQIIADLRASPSADPHMQALTESTIKLMNASKELSPEIAAFDLELADFALAAEYPAWAAAQSGLAPSRSELRGQLRAKAKAWAARATLKDLEARHAACLPLHKAIAASMPEE